MGLIIVFLIVGLIFFVLVLSGILGGGGSKSVNAQRLSASSSPPMRREEKILNDNKAWMNERWDAARIEQESGELKSVPKWFFDDVTEYQLKKIAEIGLNIKSGHLTKGQASDIIGLFEPAEDGQREILNFFKIPIKGMNQSRARYEVGKIFQDPVKVESWENRPASTVQKEFFKFFNLKAPANLTHKAAIKYIEEYKNKQNNNSGNKIDEWDEYLAIYDEINEPDFREDYDLKNISLTLFRSAMNSLRTEGKNLKELSDDLDLVVDKLIELKPEIQKS